MTPSLADLPLRTSYAKGRDIIDADFYLPAMRAAVAYDRAVGYFRSTAFLIAWPALRDFAARGGRMRVLCSQVLSAEDIRALDEGYAARVDDRIAARLAAEVESLLADEAMGAPARVLAALVAEGILDLEIALLRPSADGNANRIFHDKVGIFRDAEGNGIMFRGSMNETWAGLAADGNLESIDVAATFLGDRDRERVEDAQSYFEDLWADRYPGLDVRPFPEIAHEALVAAADPDWKGAVERLLESPASEDEKPKRTLKAHQAAGLASWRANGRRGILAFVTGAGKTFTALDGIREALRLGEVPVVIVPDRLLFVQWLDELVPLAAEADARILKAGADHSAWRPVLSDFTAAGDQPRIVLATVPTARSEDFRSRLRGGPHLLLVADEVHRLGSRENRALLDDALFGARLGLSATPERAGDPEGTAAILDYFGGVLEPRYTLADAIRDRVLTPYFYNSHRVELTESEADEWRTITRKIGRARAAAGDLAPGDRSPGIEMLLFQRARIVKQAHGKVGCALDVIGRFYERGQRWIVYCDDRGQLDEVRTALKAGSIDTMAYYAEMPADRDATMTWFRGLGGILVAIRCLDEGVDIPEVDHALILASSKNPREYVQRRGRVLRRAEGKVHAHIHDAVVVPPPSIPGAADGGPDPITAGEIARAVEFARGASNSGAEVDVARMAISAGIDWRELFSVGVEDDDD